MAKVYQDYGEYLEDAYEEWCEKMVEEQQGQYERVAQYGPSSNRLTIVEVNGTLRAEWSREQETEPEEE